MEQRRLILITNDDGYRAQGISVLTEVMRRLGDVIVVAPDGPRSGAACAITPTLPVKLTTLKDEPGYTLVSCSGTPVDCVKLATEKVCKRLPDLVVSGINHGDNASINVHYSGTMGATLEACMKGIPAIGFSLRTFQHQCDFSPYVHVIEQISRKVLDEGLPMGTCLNVNFPEVDVLKGVRYCRMACGEWSQEWGDANNQRHPGHYWLEGAFRSLEPDAEDTDWWALEHGFASVVPQKVDMTDYELLNRLQ